MPSITHILSQTQHRPYVLPEGNWVYYQEWNRALFLHYKVPYESLRELVPNDLYLDSYDEDYYVSLVAFTMEKIRPKYLPSVGFISDFDEINVRTYVEKNGKKGVYFLNIEAGKMLSTLIAKSLSGLPYEFSSMKRTENQYISHNKKKNFHFETAFEIGNHISQKTELDLWITERYCLFLDSDNTLYRYDIHHEEWKIKSLHINKLNVDYRLKNIHLTPNFDLCHYSEGTQVISWSRVKL
ncbi:YqjF family protein [Capnocytophaga cynodegmi]|uniref:YqjF family protein n=1 Tax=Capnocytophaga cynodegmi TaxID=28189 RepID=UPI0037CF1140